MEKIIISITSKVLFICFRVRRSGNNEFWTNVRKNVYLLSQHEVNDCTFRKSEKIFQEIDFFPKFIYDPIHFF